METPLWVGLHCSLGHRLDQDLCVDVNHLCRHSWLELGGEGYKLGHNAWVIPEHLEMTHVFLFSTSTSLLVLRQPF